MKNHANSVKSLNLKWIGRIKNLECDDTTFNLVGEIELKDGVYHTRKFEEFDDGGIRQELSDIGWEKTLTWAKRRLNQDTHYNTRDWNWKRVD